jgi:maltose phosphorylase
MDKYLLVDPWKIIEDGFHQERNRVSESIFSIGNGRFGLYVFKLIWTFRA